MNIWAKLMLPQSVTTLHPTYNINSNRNKMIEKIQSGFQNWMDNHPHLLMYGLSSLFTILGILLMIGAVKDWDWVYKPTGDYRFGRQWSIGKISYLLGRKTARVYGFLFGLLFILPIGIFLGYFAIIKK